jgi:hypothetical protein
MDTLARGVHIAHLEAQAFTKSQARAVNGEGVALSAKWLRPTMG